MTKVQRIATEHLNGWIEAGCDVRSVPDLVNLIVASIEGRKLTKEKLLNSPFLLPLMVMPPLTQEAKAKLGAQ